MLTNTSPSHNEDCMMVKTSLLNKLPARKSKEVFIFQLHRHTNSTLNKHLLASKPGSLWQQTWIFLPPTLGPDGSSMS